MFKTHEKLVKAVLALLLVLAGYTANAYDDKAVEFLSEVLTSDADTSAE